MTDPNRLRTILQAILALAVGAFVVLLVWILVTLLEVTNSIETYSRDNADTTQKIRDTQKSSRSILNYINDCTKPQGECYKESEARDAAQLGAFNAAVIATRLCGDKIPVDHPHRERALTLCVGRRLEGRRDNEAPTDDGGPHVRRPPARHPGRG